MVVKPVEIFLSEDLKSCPETPRPDLKPGVLLAFNRLLAEAAADGRASIVLPLALGLEVYDQTTTSLGFGVASVGDNVICDRRRGDVVKQVERNNAKAAEQ